MTVNTELFLQILNEKYPNKFTPFPWNCGPRIEYFGNGNKLKLLSISAKLVKDDLIGNSQIYSAFTVGGINQQYEFFNILELFSMIEKETGMISK